MKKSIKYFMLGAGTVIAGLAVYVFFKESKEDCESKSNKNDDVTDVNHIVRPTVTISREFVERRRELARKRAAERAAEKAAEKAAATVAAIPTAEPDKTDGITDSYMKPVIEDSLKSEEIEEATQKDNVLLIETKPVEEGEDDNDERE